MLKTLIARTSSSQNGEVQAVCRHNGARDTRVSNNQGSQYGPQNSRAVIQDMDPQFVETAILGSPFPDPEHDALSPCRRSSTPTCSRRRPSRRRITRPGNLRPIPRKLRDTAIDHYYCYCCCAIVIMIISTVVSMNLILLAIIAVVINS